MTNATQIIQTMNDAVDRGVFPSAQLLVAKKGDVILDESFGNARPETIFDVASLTKPISTATLIMQLVASDKIRLDDSITLYLPQCFHDSKKSITLRHLLSHSSGLPSWQPYYQIIPTDDIGKPAGKLQIIEAISNEPLTYPAGYQSIYSDLGFILLGDMIEHITRESLDNLFSSRIAKPLDLQNTFYIRLNKEGRRPAFIKPEGFAPTEHCPWRNRVLRGEVHDQNCYAIGGVAGHAGLFSTTGDIHKFILALTNSFKGQQGFLSKEILERFLPFHYKLTECNSTWLLGWDTPDHINSQAGSHFSQKSIGHLGYTGCSMWIDLDKDFWIILLTNRIHPTTTNEKIKSFRPMIYNMIYEEIIAS
jgi:CubicO group peptidase (beta-lactamase class C family)